MRTTEFGIEIPRSTPSYARYGSTLIGAPADVTWLRIAKYSVNGEDRYTGYTSRDHQTWTRGGTWTAALGSRPRIGLVAMNRAGFTAQFRYVHVYQATAGSATMPGTGPGPVTPTPAARVLQLSGAVNGFHDPSIAGDGSKWYAFSSNQCGGSGFVPVISSSDLLQWSQAGCVFPGVPDWALAAVPGATSIWAPDVSYANGQYRLFYAVSTFGSNQSVIGLATNRTLDSASPDYKWVDQRLVGIHAQR